MAPADYERKQTLVNAERFTTPELKEYEVKILTAHDRAIEIEKRIFAELRRFVLDAAGRIRRAAMATAEADCWLVLRTWRRGGGTCGRSWTKSRYWRLWRRGIR